MAQRLLFNDRQVWLKHYGDSSRRFTLALLDWFVRRLSIESLRPPRHSKGDQALCIEVRRLNQLKAADVHVPDVLGRGRATLVLADLGASLSRCLKRVSADPDARDRLVARAIDAIADVHAKGLYLGNPAPRNMTFANDCIGFLDFEEDPGEIMALESAQTRDWLLFLYDVVPHYPMRHVELAGLLQAGLERANPEVRRGVLNAGSKLQRIVCMVRPFMKRNGKICSALRTLRYIADGTLLVVIGLANAALIDDDDGSVCLNLMEILL